MIVWGGYVSVKCSIGCLCAGCPCLCPHPFDTGGRYNPITNSWTATSTTNAPSARSGHTAVWTGSEMIVWGGYDNTGGRVHPSTDSWTATTNNNAPAGRFGHTAVWTENKMIIWGGVGCDGDCALNTGGKGQPQYRQLDSNHRQQRACSTI